MQALFLAALTALGIGGLAMPASAAPASGIAVKQAADTLQPTRDVWYRPYGFYRPYAFYRPYYYRPFYYRPYAFYYRPYYRPFYRHYAFRRW
jgi:hypothetical protein